MAYYVLGSGGAKYGPVDIAVLNTWALDGRVMPDTLLEDAGSGVKSPARAVRGLQFAALPQPHDEAGSTPPGVGRVQPFGGSTPHQPPSAPGTQSNYMRPGVGTGGSRSNLFLPGVDTNWAWQGFACVAVAIPCALILAYLHWYSWYLGKVLLFAFALPVFGVLRGCRGLQINRPLALVVITLNVVTFLGAVGLALRDWLG